MKAPHRLPFSPGHPGTFTDGQGLDPLTPKRKRPQTNRPGTVGWLELKPPSTAIACPFT
jgi:hypothetical protein